mgnify:CR=1 FL=1
MRHHSGQDVVDSRVAAIQRKTAFDYFVFYPNINVK